MAKWVPRDLLQDADALSRAPDASDWVIAPVLYDQVCKRFQVKPEVDLFSSDVHYTAETFVSKLYTPGCAAIDAYCLDWADFCKGRLAWVFPPTRAVSVALSCIERLSINALVMLPPLQSSNEYIQLMQMTSAQISQPFFIPKADTSLTVSLRVPAGVLNPAYLELAVYKIIWD
jgi:hypothetical protein